MSDVASSLPVRSEQDPDQRLQTKVVDFTNPANGAKIDAAGNQQVINNNPVGTPVNTQTIVAGAAIDPRATRALTAADVVTANQGAANTAANGWPVKPTDGVNSQSFTAAGEAKVSVTQPLPAGTNSIGTVKAQLQDNAGTAITLGQKAKAASVPVVLASDSDPIPVTISVDAQGTEIHDYKKATALAANASDNHDYTVTALKAFKGTKFWASASGKIKAEVQTADDGVTFATKYVGFNSTSNPNIDIPMGNAIIPVPAAGKVRIIVTNLDKNAQDVYSTIQGVEV